MINSFWIVIVCIIMLFTPSLSHASKTHKVKKNESLYVIAKKYHVHVAELKAANNLVNNHIKKGDKLVIPPAQSLNPMILIRRARPQFTGSREGTLLREWPGKQVFQPGN